MKKWSARITGEVWPRESHKRHCAQPDFLSSLRVSYSMGMLWYFFFADSKQQTRQKPSRFQFHVRDMVARARGEIIQYRRQFPL